MAIFVRHYLRDWNVVLGRVRFRRPEYALRVQSTHDASKDAIRISTVFSLAFIILLREILNVVILSIINKFHLCYICLQYKCVKVIVVECYFNWSFDSPTTRIIQILVLRQDTFWSYKPETFWSYEPQPFWSLRPDQGIRKTYGKLML